MAEKSKNLLHGSGTMTTQEIVKQNVERMEPGADWEAVYGHLYAAIKSDKFRMLRCGNTLLFFRVTPPEASMAHIFTTDKQEDLMKALREFGQSLKIGKYTKITGIVRNASLLRIIRKANSINFQVKDTPIRSHGDTGDVVGYKLEIGVAR